MQIRMQANRIRVFAAFLQSCKHFLEKYSNNAVFANFNSDVLETLSFSVVYLGRIYLFSAERIIEQNEIPLRDDVMSSS